MKENKWGFLMLDANEKNNTIEDLNIMLSYYEGYFSALKSDLGLENAEIKNPKIQIKMYHKYIYMKGRLSRIKQLIHCCKNDLINQRFDLKQVNYYRKLRVKILDKLINRGDIGMNYKKNKTSEMALSKAQGKPAPRVALGQVGREE